MEVFFVNAAKQGTTMNIPLRGGMRGKGKRSVWVDLDSLVMIAETGLAGATHEIVGVLTETHIARYKKVFPDADARLFLKNATADTKMEEETFEFEKEEEEKEEVDVDAI